jgi:hypothetical protein
VSEQTLIAGFAHEEDLLGAVGALQDRGWSIVDVYAPYAVHGLEDVLKWRRSWLPAACFLGGALGAGLAAWFQYWATASDWPLNVGGRPWNSLPAFVPVIFECMVLLAGFSLVIAFLVRCGLYPGNQAEIPYPGITDNRFAVVFRVPHGSNGGVEAQKLLQEFRALSVKVRDEENKQ